MSGSADTVRISHPMARRIGALADELGTEAYVVGGYVRDALLGRDDADLDVVVMGDGIAFARAVADRIGVRNVLTFERFGTATLFSDQGKIEFVGARSEVYRDDSRKPEVRAASLKEDLQRRDFTVNAMAAALNGARFGGLLDPLGGRDDLKRAVLRTPLDPEATFAEDPLRMMRAFRFAAQLEFSIADEALAAIRDMRERLAIVSQERVTEEFLRLLKTPKPSTGLWQMFETGLLDQVFPEIAQMAGVDQRRDHHHKDVLLHTLQVVDNLAPRTDNVWLRFAGLVHDIGKPRTKSYQEGAGWTFHGHEEIGARMLKRIFRRMRLPMDPLPYVEKLTRLHLRPMVLVDETVTDSAVRRLVFEAGEAIDDLMTLCRADITSKKPALVARYFSNYERVMDKVAEVIEKDRLRSWQPPVRGDEIMAVCGIPPGRKVGELKKAIEEAILDGRIPNEHDAALAYLLSIKHTVLAETPPREHREE